MEDCAAKSFRNFAGVSNGYRKSEAVERLRRGRWDPASNEPSLVKEHGRR